MFGKEEDCGGKGTACLVAKKESSCFDNNAVRVGRCVLRRVTRRLWVGGRRDRLLLELGKRGPDWCWTKGETGNGGMRPLFTRTLRLRAASSNVGSGTVSDER